MFFSVDNHRPHNTATESPSDADKGSFRWDQKRIVFFVCLFICFLEVLGTPTRILCIHSSPC